MSTLPVDEDACKLVMVVVRRVIEMLPVEVLTLSEVRLGLFDASTETLPVEVLMFRSVTLTTEVEMTTPILEPVEDPETASIPVFEFEVFITDGDLVKKGKTTEG